MFLGYGILGYDIDLGGDSRYLPLIQINSITFGSNEHGATLDKIWGEDGMDLTEEMFRNMAVDSYDPTWTDTTYMLADFGGDFLNAGQIQPKYDCQFNSYALHKVYQNNGTTVDEVVDNDISGDAVQYKDYMNSHDCYYYLTVNGNNLTADNTYWSATTNYSNEVQQTPWGYYFIDEENEVSYFFNIEFSGGTENWNTNTNQYAMNKTADYWFRGNNNMASGEVTGILYSGNSFSDDGNTVATLDAFKEFFNSKRKCLMKDRFGNSMHVILTSYSEQYLNIFLPKRIIGSTVGWKEVASNG